MKKIYRSLTHVASVFLLLFMAFAALAQSRVVTGTITDDQGSPMPGVNVVIKGTTTGTTTNGSGVYSIQTNENDILVMSFIGYTSQEILVQSQTKIDVRLSEDIATLQEVVFMGYGEMRKADLTTAQTSITSKDIGRTINTTLDQAIQGRSAGVYVTQNTGAPGGGVSVNIRGVNSINGSNEPLYVVDGVQIEGGTMLSGTNPMSNLNPNDIASLEILQGPNATAIYGSRGTNGVVLITTKRGKAGEMKVNYSFTFSMQDRPKNLDVMSLRQFGRMHKEYKIATDQENTIREEFKDPSLLGNGTDWQGALFQRAAMQQHQVSISGGSEKTTFYISGERMSQEGVGLGSGFDRTSVRVNVDNKVREWLKIGSNIMVSQTNQDLGTMGGSGLWNNLVLNAVQLGPDIPIKNLDGTYGAGNTDIDNSQQFTPANPVGLASLITNEQLVRSLIGGVNAALKIYKGLEFSTSFNTNVGYTNSTLFYPTYEFGAYHKNSTATLQNRANYNIYWGFNQQINYSTVIAKHRINAMVTHEAQESYYKNMLGSRQGFPVNNLLDLNVGDSESSANAGGQGPWAMESFLGRIAYNFDDRYIITAVLRADGSSNFAPENKWGYFPSISAAYRISNEKFFNVPVVNDLRLRFETGTTGNQGNGGAIYGALNSGPSEFGPSYYPQRFPNPFYGWEETKTNNVGITLGLLDSRIQLDADFYIKDTENLSLQSSLPMYMGTSGNGSVSPPFVNVGSLQNKGWSFTINTVNINSGGLKWETNLNLSGFDTEVKSLTTKAGKVDRVLGSPKNNTPFTQRTEVGYAPWQFIGNIQDGVFVDVDDVTNSPRPVDSNGELQPVGENGIWVGDAKYRDINDDGKIDEKDLTAIGNPWPKVFGGLTNNFSYKGFDLSVLVTASFGNDIYNLMRDEQTNPNNLNVGRNMYASTLDYAKLSGDGDATVVTNPGTNVPRILGNSGVNNNYGRYTSTYVEDGSYVRIKNISLTYHLPESLIGRQNIVRAVRIGVSGQNLFTFTKYSGYDPEVGAYVGPSYSGETMIGVDYGRYPLTRVYSFNIGVDF